MAVLDGDLELSSKFLYLTSPRFNLSENMSALKETMVVLVLRLSIRSKILLDEILVRVSFHSADFLLILLSIVNW